MRVSVRDAVNEFLAVKYKKRGGKTCDGYKQRLYEFCDWIDQENMKRKQNGFDAYYLDGITSHVIDDFIIYLKAEHKPHRKTSTEISSATIVGYVRCIKIFLNWTLEDEEYGEQLRPVSIKRIKLPEQETLLIKPFQDHHIQTMIEHCCDRQEKLLREGRSVELAFRDELIIRLLIATGIRADELCTLTIEHIYLNPDECYVRVHGKRNKWREIPLIAFPVKKKEKKNTRTQKQIAKQMEFRNDKGKQLQPVQLDDDLRRDLKYYRNKYRSQAASNDSFFIDSSQKCLNTGSLEKIIQRIIARTEILFGQTSPHVFRHTFAVLFMRHVSNVYLLSKLMGHSSVRTTEEYLKSLQGEEVRAAFLRQIGEL